LHDKTLNSLADVNAGVTTAATANLYIEIAEVAEEGKDCQCEGKFYRKA
jgi:hypothetical protein